jgi:Na+/H+-translocating membrane pyrophosphatase
MSNDSTFNIASTDQERLAAMRVIADAMEEGMRQGLHRDALTVACFTVVMQLLVEVYGREAVNTLVSDMGPRVIAGDFG